MKCPKCGDANCKIASHQAGAGAKKGFAKGVAKKIMFVKGAKSAKGDEG